MWQYGNGMSGWGFGLMTIGNLLVWALIVVGVVALLRHLNRRESGVPRPTAEELLAERFARGDIRAGTSPSRSTATGSTCSGSPGPTRTADHHLRRSHRDHRAPRATYCVIGRWPGILRPPLGPLCPASMLCGRALWGP